MKPILPIKERATDILVGARIPEAMSYRQFRILSAQLADEGRTTGDLQEQSYIDYTLLNEKRMKRWDKTFKLPGPVSDRIREMDLDIYWLVLTESWCGDAAPSLPVMNAIAELNPGIDFGILIRDEHPGLMERFRTRGALSIPKLIQYDMTLEKVTGEWGPRPATASGMAEKFKKENGGLNDEFRAGLQQWYNADKGHSITRELLELLGLK